MPVLVVCPDLLLRSRILAACQAAAVEHRSVKPADVAGAVRAGDVALVDLEAPGALDACRAAVAAGARVVGFAGHLDVARLAAARADGVDAMARGAFVAGLASLVRTA